MLDQVVEALWVQLRMRIKKSSVENMSGCWCHGWPYLYCTLHDTGERFQIPNVEHMDVLGTRVTRRAETSAMYDRRNLATNIAYGKHRDLLSDRSVPRVERFRGYRGSNCISSLS